MGPQDRQPGPQQEEGHCKGTRQWSAHFWSCPITVWLGRCKEGLKPQASEVRSVGQGLTMPMRILERATWEWQVVIQEGLPGHSWLWCPVPSGQLSKAFWG